MDFNADECRLVIVKTLPRAINTQEEFISAYLRDSGFMRRRLNQRIVQALGRCNRSEEDYGVYVLADRRFATHFGREANRDGIPSNMVAEIDAAQDGAETDEQTLLRKVERFLNRDFTEYDNENQTYRAEVPVVVEVTANLDTSADEVLGWTALFASQNYEVAASKFENCWETARAANVREIGAFHGWNWAKTLFLQSLLGEANARDRALQVFEDALARGGQSSWFNRMRASLNRVRQTPVATLIVSDYAAVLVRAFDDLLERLGTTGTRFDRWCESLKNGLQSEHHDQFAEALEKLGNVLGYHASRPRYQTATDCRWRGLFGNYKEVVTFEAKVEHTGQTAIAPVDVGQAHNQLARAQAEYAPLGYIVRGAIVTHMNAIDPGADASAGVIKLMPKDALIALWERIRLLLSLYRGQWSLDDMGARTVAADGIQSRIPQTGWLARALDSDERFVTENLLLAEWAAGNG
jgi:hypothetical protein